jgi:hypothetical protein
VNWTAEFDLEDELVRILADKGLRVVRQVRLGGKQVDVIAEGSEGDLWSIEVKVSDWRRAASQAALNVPYFHASFIALPANERRKLDVGFLKALGVGVLEIEQGSYRVSVEPKMKEPSPSVISAMREALRP